MRNQHAAVQALTARGLGIRAIARELNVDRKTARRFAEALTADSAVARAISRPHRPGPLPASPEPPVERGLPRRRPAARRNHRTRLPRQPAHRLPLPAAPARRRRAWPDQRISGALPGRERAFNQGQMNHRNRGASGSVNRWLGFRCPEPNAFQHLPERSVSRVFTTLRAFLLVSRCGSWCVTVRPRIALITDAWRTGSGLNQRCTQPLGSPVLATVWPPDNDCPLLQKCQCPVGTCRAGGCA
jgi:hypothetical protein